MIVYEDFSVKIEPKRGDVYPVIVLRSPAGEGRSTFRLPFDPAELGTLLVGLGDSVRGVEPAQPEAPAAATPQEVGDALFNALFSGPVRSLLDRSMGMIHGQEKGLRIKIHVDPEEPSLAPLSSLPWEFIYRKDTHDFLNLSRFTPILRYLDVQRPYTPLPLEPPLRILVVMSEPEGFVGLDLQRERALIESTWAQQGDVEVDFMENATMLALQDRLSEEKWHVLHYMGHGAFDEASGRGVLVLEDQRQQGVMVDGTTLGILLRDASSLRLVFLNACETARVGQQQGLDPFAGVAAAMVLAGVPAVVAMQFPITDQAAIQFSQRFYPLLARGYPVDEAVAEGRRAIRLANASTLEWGTPVLFMRAPNGEIFKVARRRATRELAEEVNGVDKTLEPLYRAGMEAIWRDDWDMAVEQFQAVASQRPDYRDVQRRLSEAQRQQKLLELYRQGETALERQDWAAAVVAFTAVLDDEPEYRDAAERREQARAAEERVARAAALYAAAGRSVKAGQWKEAQDQLAQLRAVDPAYPDPEGLAGQVEAVLAAGKRPGAAAMAPEPAPARVAAAQVAVPAPQPAVPAPKPARSRGFLKWILAAVGLMAIAVVVSLLLIGGGDEGFEDGSTPAAVAAAPSATPTAVPALGASSSPEIASDVAPQLITDWPASAYTGPGTIYSAVGTTEAGQALEVVGRDASGDWLQVCCVAGAEAWVEADQGRLEGELAQVAMVEVAPLAATPEPTSIPTVASPSDTPEPAATPTAVPPTDTPEPTPTPTEAPPTVPIVTASGDTNLRAGPGTNYGVVGRLTGGESLEVTGRNQDGSWWQVAIPGGDRGWIIASRVTAAGPLDEVAIVVLPTPTAAPTAVTNLPLPGPPGMLEDFEAARTWQRGDEPYGQLRRTTGSARNGVYGGELSYDFAAVPGNYVVFGARPSTAIPGEPEAITAWVFGDGSGHFLNAWVQGSDGEVRSYTFGRINHQGWQPMTAALDDSAGWPNGHISGADNGALDFPARLYGLVLDGVPDGAASQGTIYLDDITATP